MCFNFKLFTFLSSDCHCRRSCRWFVLLISKSVSLSDLISLSAPKNAQVMGTCEKVEPQPKAVCPEEEEDSHKRFNLFFYKFYLGIVGCWTKGSCSKPSLGNNWRFGWRCFCKMRRSQLLSDDIYALKALKLMLNQTLRRVFSSWECIFRIQCWEHFKHRQTKSRSNVTVVGNILE